MIKSRETNCHFGGFITETIELEFSRLLNDAEIDLLESLNKPSTANEKQINKEMECIKNMHYFNLKKEQPSYLRMINSPYREVAINYFNNLKKEEKVEDNTNWKFHSSADEDINWKDIKYSLNYAEPLALVTRKYRDYVEAIKYVVVAKELVKKAKVLNMLCPCHFEEIEKNVYQITGEFSEYVDWAKAVKAASWPDGIKSTLNVVLPTI